MWRFPARSGPSPKRRYSGRWTRTDASSNANCKGPLGGPQPLQLRRDIVVQPRRYEV